MSIESIKSRIKHLSNAAQRRIVRSVLDVIPGTTFVNEDTAAARLEICERCNFMDVDSRRCKKCLCFIDEKTRVRAFPFGEPEHCPINKW